MYLLIPGRHQLNTQFQFEYLSSLVTSGLVNAKDIYGKELNIDKPIEAIIFAVTSANHSNTREIRCRFTCGQFLLRQCPGNWMFQFTYTVLMMLEFFKI